MSASDRNRDAVLDFIKTQNKDIRLLKKEIDTLENNCIQLKKLQGNLTILQSLYDQMMEQHKEVIERYRKAGDEARDQRKAVEASKRLCEKLQSEVARGEKPSPHEEAKNILVTMQQTKVEMAEERRKWIAKLDGEMGEIMRELQNPIIAFDEEQNKWFGLLSNDEKLAELKKLQMEIVERLQQKEDLIRRVHEGDYSENPSMVALEKRYSQLKSAAAKNDLIHARQRVFRYGAVSLEEPEEQVRIIADLEKTIAPQHAKKAEAQSKYDEALGKQKEAEAKYEESKAEYARIDAQEWRPIVQQTKELHDKIEAIEEEMRQYGKLAPALQQLQEKEEQLRKKERDLESYLKKVKSMPVPQAESLPHVSKQGFFSHTTPKRHLSALFENAKQAFFTVVGLFQKTKPEKPPVINDPKAAKDDTPIKKTKRSGGG